MATTRDERRWPQTLRNMVQQPVPATVAPLEPSGAYRLGQFLRQAPENIAQGVGQAATSTAAAVRDRAVLPTLAAGQDFYYGISGRDVPPVRPGAVPVAQTAPTPVPPPVTPPPPVAAAPTEVPVSRPVVAPPTVAAQPAPAVDRATPFGAVYPARGGQAGYTVTAPQAERAGQRVNTLPSFPSAGGGIGGGVQDRSAALDQLYLQALGRVNSNQLRSYGDLFRRKRDMNTLAQLGPLVQSGASNVVQASGNELQAGVAMRGQDVGLEGDRLRTDAARYGVDRNFESNANQQATTLQGYMLQAEATKAAAGTKAAQDARKLAVENPLARLAMEAASGRTIDAEGKWRNLTADEHAERVERYQSLRFSPNGLDLLGLGAQ